MDLQICFTNQFSYPYMPQVPYGSHLRTYFSTEIMKTSQRHPNIRKPLCILTIPKSKTNSALKMTMTPKSFRKPRLSSIKSCNMYKPTHWLARQVNVLVSTRRWSLLKGASRKTSVSSLFPHYQAYWCHNSLSCILYCLHLLIISVRLFNILPSLWSAIANFSFRHNMHRFVDALYD